jgi:hypothetical protein
MVSQYCVPSHIIGKLCISSMVSGIWNICNNDRVYNSLYRNVLSSEQTWHTVLCAVYNKPLTAT